MLLPQKPKEYDSIFIRNMMKVSSQREINEIVGLLEKDPKDIEPYEREKIELFMLKVNQKIGSWKDSIHGLYQNFDVDVFTLVTSSKVLSGHLGVEYKPSKTLDLVKDSGMF